METYENLYQASLMDSEVFWRKEGQRIDWIKPYTKVQEGSFEGNIDIQWYQDGLSMPLRIV